jgi:hypothetical protein
VLEKTHYGSVSEIVSGEGVYNDVMEIDIGSSGGIEVGNMGWVDTHDGKAIAYFVITEVMSESSYARISVFPGCETMRISPGMNVGVIISPQIRGDGGGDNENEPDERESECVVLESHAFGCLSGPGELSSWVIESSSWEKEVSFQNVSDTGDIWIKVIGEEDDTVLADFSLSEYTSMALVGGGAFTIEVYSKSGAGEWELSW